jgi:hypothetical protein
LFRENRLTEVEGDVESMDAMNSEALNLACEFFYIFSVGVLGCPSNHKYHTDQAFWQLD